ncbi:FG-GAP-like repeat-containing protein [Streptomyces morookaense]|uniref:FG-GAP-like repeat-containing protein n=1 Tax=Streptomyces morookaense TaxID=1970 RepID=UPI0033F2238C
MPVMRPRVAWVAGALASVVTASLMSAAPSQAVVGTTAKDGSYPFVAKLDIGGKRSCSAALVDQQWLLTAASCFADNPAQSIQIPAGAPSLKTTATIGGADLTRDSGTVVDVAELVPRPDRDLVMARLAKPVAGITPADISANSPLQGEELWVAGYGRTKDEWVPNNLHYGKFAVGSVKDTSIGITAKSDDAAVCQGDTGGPAYRVVGGRYELAGINSMSGQGGCLGADSTQTSRAAKETRLDDIATWIQRLRLTTRSDSPTNVVAAADFNGDGRTDIAAVLNDGSLVAFYSGPDGVLEYGRELWHDKTWDGMKKIIGGDFNGDGVADIMAIAYDGSLRLYSGNAGGKLSEGRKVWNDASWSTMSHVVRYKDDGWKRDGLMAVRDDGALFAYPTSADGAPTSQRTEKWGDRTWTKRLLTSGDFNGDGRDDLVAVANDGTLQLYVANGKGSFDSARSMWPEKEWGAMQYILAGDFNGDGKGDIFARWGRGTLRWYQGDGKGAIAAGRPVWPTNP